MWNLFSIFDFLSSINMRPIFEVSFTPSELASNPNDSLMHYRANSSPAADMNKWYSFIKDLVQALVDRYGIDEIRLWRFEFYNEPNCGFFNGTKEEWFSMYNATAWAIKSVDPFIPVGGPATAGLGGDVCKSKFGPLGIREFLDYTSMTKTPADIVTTHLYPTDGEPTVSDVRDGFADAIKEAALNVSLFGPAGMPLVVTEFNAGENFRFSIKHIVKNEAPLISRNSTQALGFHLDVT